jgi:uncharacterized protein YbjT (DUF2867 family)
MKVLLFGSTGMIGQGVLRECLLDPGVEQVITVGRGPTGQQHARLRDIVLPDVTDLSTIEPQLAGIEACFFCLGVTSAGMSEEDYSRVTFDLTLAIAGTLARVAPGMTFIYVSGMGADSGEQGRTMWARVKGRTENALLRLPFRAAYMFRPGLIIPLHGIQSRTRWYRLFYTTVRPLNPVLKRLFPAAVTTTEQLARAMIAVAYRGYPVRVLETRDINTLGHPATGSRR